MTESGANTGGPVEFSILIGLVSTQDRKRIFEVLDAIENQSGGLSFEVIIADRRQDDISETIDKAYPAVKRLACPGDCALPELRRRALENAGGRFIVVTEDHCVPAVNWLEAFHQVFERLPSNTAAVGGCVNNGVTETALDRATYLCEYGAFAEPVMDGFTPVLPGMNIAYRHEVLKTVDKRRLEMGFWETTVHPQLVQNGYQLYSSNLVKITHSKRFSLGLFTRQRFLYSRYYASLRYPPEKILLRCAASVATVLLPVLLLIRSLRTAWSKPILQIGYLSALPVLMLFYLAWAAGEMVGYLRGDPSALQQLE